MNSLYFILGMQRSGTSLTTQILSKMGIYMGEKELMKQPDRWNEKGYGELMELIDLNEFMFVSMGKTAFSLEDINKLTPLGKKELENFEKKYLNVNKSIAIKDPALSVLWKVFVENISLSKHIVKGIISVRNPYEVAMSLKERSNIERERAFCIWYFYNWKCLEFAQNYKSLFISYSNYFNEFSIQYKNVLTFLENDKSNCSEKEIKNIVDASLYHQSINNIYNASEIEMLCYEFYNKLLLLCDGKKNVEDVKKESINNYNKVIEYGRNNIDRKKEDEWVRSSYVNHILINYKEYAIQQLEKKISLYNKKIVLCGNGRNIQKLIPILERTKIEIDFICDKSNFKERRINSKNITVLPYEEILKNKQNSEKRIYIITTTNYTEQIIRKELLSYINDKQIITLYNLLKE